jgi:hypothetical protein
MSGLSRRQLMALNAQVVASVPPGHAERLLTAGSSRTLLTVSPRKNGRRS